MVRPFARYDAVEEALVEFGVVDRADPAQVMRQFITSADWRRTQFTPLLHLGRYREAGRIADVLEQFRDQGQLSLSPWISLAHAYRGRLLEAQALLDQFLAAANLAETPTETLTRFLATAVLLGDRDAVRRISIEIVPLTNDAIAFCDQTCPARHLGDSFALLGDY